TMFGMSRKSPSVTSTFTILAVTASAPLPLRRLWPLPHHVNRQLIKQPGAAGLVLRAGERPLDKMEHPIGVCFQTFATLPLHSEKLSPRCQALGPPAPANRPHNGASRRDNQKRRDDADPERDPKLLPPRHFDTSISRLSRSARSTARASCSPAMRFLRRAVLQSDLNATSSSRLSTASIASSKSSARFTSTRISTRSPRYDSAAAKVTEAGRFGLVTV